ncbi:glycosyltransferase family 8 protein [Actinobacillus equuli]|uniref:glycosyltransferase family 8 protein n=1 Tax=Actinobacillus equuli TaxID=718 RepID=UPI00241889B4|nr:glycosyltransferase family 8 protein [Actinobacillus equuli]MDG4953060.1 glycosyltransferase family 8 protein [Actinobacillus equuli subsp. equuli]
MSYGPMHIVLSADRKYAEQVITLIKSICFYDTNVHFYLINKDYSNEWFKSLNQYLAYFQSEIINVSVQADVFQQLKTIAHVSEISFYRCLIPQIISADKVLYLDSDIIVNGSLRELYDHDISDYMLGAVEDYILSSRYFKHSILDCYPYFNSGVLLLNNKKWREIPDLQQKLLETIEQYNRQGGDLGDQDILNMLFMHTWLPLHRKYNYQFGNYYYLQQLNHFELYPDIMDIGEQQPLVIHYNCAYKPWVAGCENQLDIEQRYWFFHRLEWAELIQYRTA